MPNCDISGNEIESKEKEVKLYTTTTNNDSEFYPTDSTEDEEEIVNTYYRTGSQRTWELEKQIVIW